MAVQDIVEGLKNRRIDEAKPKQKFTIVLTIKYDKDKELPDVLSLLNKYTGKTWTNISDLSSYKDQVIVTIVTDYMGKDMKEGYKEIARLIKMVWDKDKELISVTTKMVQEG